MQIKVNKEKLVISITIGISCLALMLVMFMQFKVVKQTDITAIETLRESELKTELSQWKEKYNLAREKYNETISKISEYQNEKVSDAKTAELLEIELKQLNEVLGKTDVFGQGIIISIIDKQGEKIDEDDYVQPIIAEDLMVLVNELFAAGAEAVSINGNRIVTTTSIVDIGNEFIKINGKSIPDNKYEIKAIGNSEYLKSSLLGKGGQGEALKELGHDVKIETKNEILIEKYDKEFSTKYIK